MSGRGRLVGMAALAAAALAGACTDTYLYDERRDESFPVDRTVALEGRFCTVGTNEVVRPIKLLLAFDGSQSMKVTDPDGTRAKAILELLDALPFDPEIHVSVMVFAGSTTAFLTVSGRNEFEPILPTYDPRDPTGAANRLRLVERLLNYTNPANDPNRDSTDFVKPLADIYAMINRDLANARLSATGARAESRARYSVIFLSDGHPTNDQDDELIRGDAVVRIRQLRDLAEDVKVNTVHVFNPTQPLSTVCDLSGDAGTGCPMLIVNQDAERLEKMAQLGGGDFRDFRNNEPINFLNFKFGQTRRTFQVKDVVAANLSAPPGSPADAGDTDGDGLVDGDELSLRTDPFRVDTDGDGFSDGVEVHFGPRPRGLGGKFNPRQVAQRDGGGLDPGCPPALRGVDGDCDGLADCDEQLIGTNARLSDSDDDGIPDGVEWRLGAQGSSKDLEQDPDSDGLVTRDELRLHGDPTVVDSAKLSVTGYRYRMRADGPVDSLGRQCYELRVDNIPLVPTMADLRPLTDGGTGRTAGWNDLYFAVSMIPGDDPTGRTLVRAVRLSDQARFPVGGVKSPVDGVLRIVPEDLVDRCQPRQP